MATVSKLMTLPLRAASSALTNAREAMADDARVRAERERLAPGRNVEGPGNRLDAIGIDDCWCFLSSAALGRIGFAAHSGHPVILPVNYSIIERQILIRTGRGPKLEAAKRGDLVAFEVDQIDAEHTGWSVLVTGRARWVREQAEVTALKVRQPASWAAGPRNDLILIDPVNVAGRYITAQSRA